jgi:hypothetical protein
MTSGNPKPDNAQRTDKQILPINITRACNHLSVAKTLCDWVAEALYTCIQGLVGGGDGEVRVHNMNEMNGSRNSHIAF